MPVRDLRYVGLAEGVSFLVLLFIAMPLKYFADMPKAVSIAGMIHGVLFLAFIACLARAHFARNWPGKKTALAFLSSIIPAGTFWLDAKLKREDPGA